MVEAACKMSFGSNISGESGLLGLVSRGESMLDALEMAARVRFRSASGVPHGMIETIGTPCGNVRAVTPPQKCAHLGNVEVEQGAKLLA